MNDIFQSAGLSKLAGNTMQFVSEKKLARSEENFLFEKIIQEFVINLIYRMRRNAIIKFILTDQHYYSFFEMDIA